MTEPDLALSRRRLLGVAAAACGVAALPVGFAPVALGQPAPPDTRADYFKTVKVIKLALTVKPADLEVLKKDPRKYVKATVRENDRVVCDDAGVRLKGSSPDAARGLDQKPSLSLNLDKFVDAQRFHGMSKVSLEGALKDPSYLRDAISAEAYRSAGSAAAQVSHAVLSINGQVRGLYLVREGYDGGFLTSRFGSSHGNFYEGGDAKDIDQPLELDRGKDDVKEQADLKALAEACKDGDQGSRYRKLETLLDLEKFTNFLVAEVVTWNRAGYALKRGNYRLYHDPKAKKIHFVPSELHGTWEPADAPLIPQATGLVARAFLETKDGLQRFRSRAKDVLAKAVTADALVKRLDEYQGKIQPMLATANAAEGKAFPGQVDALKAGVKQRLAKLNELAK